MRARVAALPAFLRRPTRMLLRGVGVGLRAAGDFFTLFVRACCVADQSTCIQTRPSPSLR